MAGKLETDIVINLAGNLANKAKRYESAMGSFARKNERSMKMIRMSARAAGRGIDRLGNRYVGLATGIATGAAVRGVAAFEAQMTRMGTNAKLTDEQVATLTKSVQDLSNHSDIRIDTTKLAAGVDALLGLTGDMKFATDNLENMGLFMQAFGVDAKTTGAIFAQFREKGVTGSKEVMRAIDKLYGQFAIGSVSVKDLADISAQLFSLYQGKGPEAITQMGALVQLFAKTKGNAHEALTSIKAVMGSFNDKKKVEFLSKQGIKVFKEGTTELRKPVELFLEIVEKAKNNPLKLSDVYDKEAIEGLASLYGPENKQLLKDMVSDNVELGATQKAAAKNAATFDSAMTSLHNSFSKFAYEELAGPIKDIADAINGVDQETVQNWLKWGETAAIAIGGVIVAKKALDAGMWAKKTFGAGGILGGKGKGNMASLGATPVYVVNMGQGGMGIGGNGSKDSFMSKAPMLAARMATIATSIFYSSSTNDGEKEWLANMRAQQAAGIGDNKKASNVPDPKFHNSRYDNLFKNEKVATRKDIPELVNNLQKRNPQSQLVYDLGGPGGYKSSEISGNVGVEVTVLDERVSAKAKSNSPFITVENDPDVGQN